MSVRSGIVFGVREVRANVTVKQGLRGCGVIVAGRDVNCSPSFLPSRRVEVNHRIALHRASFPASGSPASQMRKRFSPICNADFQSALVGLLKEVHAKNKT